MSKVDELHRRIGRNLLRFQAIELSLKFMLPYVHPDGGTKGAEAMRAYQSKNVTGKSLGLLRNSNLRSAGRRNFGSAALPRC